VLIIGRIKTNKDNIVLGLRSLGVAILLGDALMHIIPSVSIPFTF
jgi:hypothetical protein